MDYSLLIYPVVVLLLPLYIVLILRLKKGFSEKVITIILLLSILSFIFPLEDNGKFYSFLDYILAGHIPIALSLISYLSSLILFMQNDINLKRKALFLYFIGWVLLVLVSIVAFDKLNLYKVTPTNNLFQLNTNSLIIQYLTLFSIILLIGGPLVIIFLASPIFWKQTELKKSFYGNSKDNELNYSKITKTEYVNAFETLGVGLVVIFILALILTFLGINSKY